MGAVLYFLKLGMFAQARQFCVHVGILPSEISDVENFFFKKSGSSMAAQVHIFCCGLDLLTDLLRTLHRFKEGGNWSSIVRKKGDVCVCRWVGGQAGGWERERWLSS